MWILLVPFILLKLLIRTTYSIPTLFISIAKTTISITTTCDAQFQEIQSSIFWEVIHWIFYVLGPIIWTLICCGAEILHAILYVPSYAWNLFWHEDGRSIMRMLRHPDELYDQAKGRLYRRTDPRGWRRGWRKYKEYRSDKKAQRSTVFMDRGPPGRIVGYNSRLCMFSYYQMDRENINKCENRGPWNDDNSTVDTCDRAMAFTQYYASTYLAAAKIFHRDLPRRPPDYGFITSSLVCLATLGIFSYITARASIRLSKMKKKNKRKRKRKRSTEAIARIKRRKV